MEGAEGVTPDLAMGNGLLSRLEGVAARELLRGGRIAGYGAGEVVTRAGDPVPAILFPLDLVVSFGSDLGGDGLIGSEGLVGWSAMTGCALSFDSTVAVLDGGRAVSLAPEAVRLACLRDPPFLRLLLRFAQTVAVQMSTTIASLRTDAVEVRLCRWLVMLHDRREGDDLPMTHERLAELLGVRRASVTDTLHRLEGEHLLRGQRGRITILDRPGLERAAGRYYGGAEAVYRELLEADAPSAPSLASRVGLANGSPSAAAH